MKGKVVSFNAKKGFGFITVDNPDKPMDDIFFYYKAIMMEGFKDIDVGQEVEFDVEENQENNENKGKLRAVNIRKI